MGSKLSLTERSRRQVYPLLVSAPLNSRYRFSRQVTKISSDVRLFLLSAPALHLLFAVECPIYSGIFFKAHKLHRQGLPCMKSSFTAIVLFQAPLHIVDTACLITSVGIFQYVHPAPHINSRLEFIISLLFQNQHFF